MKLCKNEIFFSLKVVCNEEGGGRKVANIRNKSRSWRSRFVCRLISVLFDFNLFLLLPSKAQFIGNDLMNRQNAAFGSTVFFLLQRALPIDAPNHLALVGDVL